MFDASFRQSKRYFSCTHGNSKITGASPQNVFLAVCNEIGSHTFEHEVAMPGRFRAHRISSVAALVGRKGAKLGLQPLSAQASCFPHLQRVPLEPVLTSALVSLALSFVASSVDIRDSFVLACLVATLTVRLLVPLKSRTLPLQVPATPTRMTHRIRGDCSDIFLFDALVLLLIADPADVQWERAPWSSRFLCLSLS